ncbi:Heterokaryon incompatibility protein (HET) domain containing protein [Naviculisporaceae sp. PSN 640]
MRLVNVQTLVLEKPRYGQATPPYAILSHTWEDDEITLQEFALGTAKIKAKKGYVKVTQACALALRDGIDYLWVDTCCIDKTSSAELAEAINSMFQWYQDARVCYAYLSDLEPVSRLAPAPPSGTKSHKEVPIDGAVKADNEPSVSQLRACRWFTRGWTLQELIAPAKVQFYDRDWKPRGTKQGMIRNLHEVTGIQTVVLESAQNTYTLPIVARMSWASKRETSRIEDMAYCLMGIFDVNMPLLYGEGKKAFTRLQHEIIKSISDLSIFGWSTGPETVWAAGNAVAKKIDLLSSNEVHPLLSASPGSFQFPANRLRPWEIANSVEYSVTNVGIRINCCLLQICLLHAKSTTVCGSENTPSSPQTAPAGTAACHTSCTFRAYVLELSNNTGGASNQGYHGGEWGIVLRKLKPDCFARASRELVWLGSVRRNSLSNHRARTTLRNVLLVPDPRSMGELANRFSSSLPLTQSGYANLKVTLSGPNIRFRSAFPESRWDYIRFAFFLETVPINQRWGLISIQISRSMQSSASSESGGGSVNRSASVQSQHKTPTDSKDSPANRTCRLCIFFDHDFTRLWILDEETAQGALSNIRRCGSEWKTSDVENCLRDAGLLTKDNHNAPSSSGFHSRAESAVVAVAGEHGHGGAYVTGTVAGREIRVDIVTNGDGSWCELGVSCLSRP